jgi:hypothetical protein
MALVMRSRPKTLSAAEKKLPVPTAGSANRMAARLRPRSEATYPGDLDRQGVGRGELAEAVSLRRRSTGVELLLRRRTISFQHGDHRPTIPVASFSISEDEIVAPLRRNP